MSVVTGVRLLTRLVYSVHLLLVTFFCFRVIHLLLFVGVTLSNHDDKPRGFWVSNIHLTFMGVAYKSVVGLCLYLNFVIWAQGKGFKK